MKANSASALFGVSNPGHFGSAETAATMEMLSATTEIDTKAVNT